MPSSRRSAPPTATTPPSVSSPTWPTSARCTRWSRPSSGRSAASTSSSTTPASPWPTNTQQDEDDFLINWDKTVAVNLTAHAHLVRLAVPHFVAAGAGRVVNIASTESIVTTAGMVAYTATKAGVVGLTKSYAVELGRQGITVNCICPGPIRTGMTAGISDADKETYAKRRVPLRRYGDPEEVAQMTLSMCLPAASFLNGAIVPVDGGMSIRHT